MVLGRVKSGAGCPTLRLVCGAAGAVRCGGGVGDGVCAAAQEAAANKTMTLRARFMMFLLLEQVSEAARVYLGGRVLTIGLTIEIARTGFTAIKLKNSSRG
jgi:hypothetical protein